MNKQTVELTAQDNSHYAAFVQGIAWAINLKAGDNFRGSYGEAIYRGLDETHAKFFSAGALVELAHRAIYLENDNGNIIHSIENK